jgi:hypothetical protein
MKNLLSFAFFLFICNHVSSQEVWSKTWNAGGTDLTNKIKSTHVQNDTIYYVTFNVCNLVGQSWDECNTIGMMDKEGNIIQESLVKDLSIIERTTKPWTITNSKILFLDGKGSFDNPEIEIKQFDRYTLDSIATNTFSLGDSIDFIFGSAIISYHNKFICTGWSRLSNTDIWPDYIIWIDSSTMQIDTILEYPFVKKSVEPQFLFIDSDNLLTMYWSGIEVANNGFGGRGFMKIDTNMNIVSNYIDSIDLGTQHSYPHAAYQMSNGNMVYKQQYDGAEQVFPIQWASDFEILCIDKTGDIQWRFNNPGWSAYGLGEKEIANITETKEGDLLACGYTRWHSNFPTLYEVNILEDTFPTFPDIDTIGLYNAPYILKLDGQTGELLWQYAILEYDEYGNTLPFVMRQVHELSDGSIIGTGWSRIYDENGTYLKDNAWVIRLPSDGCMEPENMECGFENYVPTSIHGPILVNLSDDKPFIIFPNPSMGIYNIIDKRTNRDLVNYVITDLNGNFIEGKNGISLTSIDLTNFVQNLFVISIYNDKGEIMQSEQLLKFIY